MRIAGKRMYLWRAVDHEGEIPDMLAVLHRGWTLVFRCLSVDRSGYDVAGFRYRPAPGLCQPQASPGVPYSVLIIND